jgi:hypothetical protein
MTASRKTESFTQRVLLALLSYQADLAEIPGRKSTELSIKNGNTNWISYPAARAEIEETIRVLIRSLANEHDIPASYPPIG